MNAVYDAARIPVRLGMELARGGEGVVYTLLGQPDLLAKVHSGAAPIEAKLTWMKDHPPVDPTAGLGHVSIAWPRDLLFDAGGACVGFRMPRIRQAVPLFDVFNPRRRARVAPAFDRRYLHRTARNLASAIGALHARDYVVGDVNESNILVTPRALVTLIDTDSFQVREQRGDGEPLVYPCPVGKAEYTPPELQGQPFRRLIRLPEHDDFALGVLIFQLLMEGNHPFRARWRGSGEPPPLEVKIRAGHFPHQKPPPGPVIPPPNTPSLDTLHPALAFLTRRCFVDGHRNPKQRPTPEEWERALAEAERALIACPNGHLYPNHLRGCPSCEAGARGPVRGRAPAERVPELRRPHPPRPPIAVGRGRTPVSSRAVTTRTGVMVVPAATPLPRRGWRWGALVAVLLGLAMILVVGSGGWALFGTGVLDSVDSFPSTLVDDDGGLGADVASGCWTADERLGDGSALGAGWSVPPAMTIDVTKRYTARLWTSEGVVEIDLLPGEAPLAVNNFVCLARAGFYDGTGFHGVVPGFVVQGGDPTGTGAGGPGYRFADEPVTREYRRGTVAMANVGPDTNGSQFFVLLDDPSAGLPARNTIFGRVSRGLGGLETIAARPTVDDPSKGSSLPVRAARIERVVIREE